MESINPTNTPSVNASMAISRKIHKQLTSKKNRWKPSELELAVLKLQFQKNKYPIKEDKEALIRTLEEQFNSKIDINQLSRWFQHEREKSVKNNLKGVQKNTYKKFGKEELDHLHDLFTKDNYPKMEEMIATAKKLGVGLSKIENWYKHNRRSLAKRGFFTLKTKKYFKRDELSYLVEMFQTCPRPTKEQINDMAERLECHESQIKNWYSNKRKKLKFMAKKSNVESIEQSLNKTSFSGHSKINSVSDLTPNSFQGSAFNSASSLQSNTYQQLLEQKSTINPNSFILNRTLPNISGQNLSNNNNLPVLVLPTNMTTPSSMVISSNVINDKNSSASSSSSTVASTNNQNDNESKFSSFGLQTAKTTQQPDISRVDSQILQSTPSLSLFSNYIQNTPSQPLSNSTIIQMPVPITNSNQNNIQLSQLQSAMNILPNKVNPVISQGNIFNVAGQNVNIGQNTPFISAIQNPYLYPLNNFNAMASIGALNQINNFNAIKPENHPMQIQYLTSLYLPYSNNNIYGNICPVMYSNPPEVGMSGQVQPQMSQITLNNLMPVTGVAFNSR